MPLRAPQVFPNDQRSWDQWTRQVKVTPDDGAVTTVTVADKAITDPKLRDSQPTSIIGRTTSSPGPPADIVASADDRFLVRRAGALAFGTIGDTDIPASIARETDVTAGDAAVTVAFQAADTALSASILGNFASGTFTPIVQGSTSAGTGTYAVQHGNYSKVLDRCLFNLRVKWSATTGTGSLRIAGLPFTSNATAQTHAAVSILNNDTNITTMVAGVVQVGVSYIEIDGFVAGTGGTGPLTIPAAGDLYIAGQYLL